MPTQRKWRQDEGAWQRTLLSVDLSLWRQALSGWEMLAGLKLFLHGPSCFTGYSEFPSLFRESLINILQGQEMNWNQIPQFWLSARRNWYQVKRISTNWTSAFREQCFEMISAVRLEKRYAAKRGLPRPFPFLCGVPKTVIMGLWSRKMCASDLNRNVLLPTSYRSHWTWSLRIFSVEISILIYQNSYRA